MSWLETPGCLPDEACQELVRSTRGGSSEWNAMLECICGGLQSNGYSEEDAFQAAINMCEEFAEIAPRMKELFEEERDKHNGITEDNSGIPE